MIRDRRASSGQCHGCHDQNGVKESELFAFHPLAAAHWGVSVRQPRSLAESFAAGLETRVVVFAIVIVALVLLFAWGAAISVTRPLSVLRHTAERLAAGDLDEPVPTLPDDEVGLLGRALDRMRVALRDSLARVEKANAELEERVKERTAELQKANVALAERDESRRAALRKVMSAQEDERRRISRELHDETSQALAALRMSLDAARPSITDEGARHRIDEARDLAGLTLDGVHRVMVDLRPSVLDDLGLESAVEWYADRGLRKKGVAVRCEFSGFERRVPPDVETALFRGAQEALSNVARHATGAENVLLQCTRGADRVTMEIEDDGAGFDPASLPPLGSSVRGLGLLGMRERMELVGGTFRFDSSPGAGTRVVFDVPVPGEVAHG
jgi:signal transduction histidine kinase